MKHIFHSYKTLADFARKIDNGKVNEIFGGVEIGTLSSHDKDASFRGTPDFATAQKLMVYGDRETADKIEKNGIARLRAELRNKTPRKQLRPAVVGFMPHVPNFVASVPVAMIDEQRKMVKSKVITIAYNRCASCGVGGSELMEAGVRLLSAILLLENRGYRVNLYCGWSTYTPDYKTCLHNWIKAKDSSQKFDVVRLAYPVAHPSFLRRHLFAGLETETGKLPKSYLAGYGSVPYTTEQKRVCTEAISQHIRGGVKVLYYTDIERLSIEQIINKLSE